jgi:hypothetical protein
VPVTIAVPLPVTVAIAVPVPVAVAIASRSCSCQSQLQLPVASCASLEIRRQVGLCYKFQRYALVYKLYHEGVCRQKDICPNSDSRSKRILDLVHSEEAQELEAAVVMSPTIYDNLKSNGTVAGKTPGLHIKFNICCISRKCCSYDNSL